MDIALIRSSRRFVYPLIVVLVFFCGYLLGRRQHPGEQADPGARAPASSRGPAMADAGSAGVSPMAPPIGDLIDPGDMVTPVGGYDDGEDIHQREMTNQELALLERETMSELARSLKDSGVPDQDIKGMLDGVAAYRIQRERRRDGLPPPVAPSVERSKEDLAQELRASLLKASVPDADVEAMVNGLRLHQENLVRPDHPNPEIPPHPVP